MIKIALVSSYWGRLEHRLLAGGLHYTENNPDLVIRTFAPCFDTVKVARDMERWGARGMFGILKSPDLQTLIASSSRPIPIVNCGAPADSNNVISLAGDFNVYLEKAITHLQRLGIKSIGMFVHVKDDGADKVFIGNFIEKTRAARLRATTLVQPVEDSIVTNPEADVCPVPEPLAAWLREIPKPAGIICLHSGGGNYLARCCSALELKVPENIAIVASDEADFCLSCKPTLTSILPPMEKLGSEAVRLLDGILQGKEKHPQTVLLGHVETIVRESTGRRHHACDIAAALEYIHNNATRGITVARVMKETQRVSAPIFHNRFRKATGKSPAEAIRDRQLEEVCRLLTDTELPLAMISELCGFSRRSVMTRTFRAAEFMTPMEYRKRHQRKSSA